MAELIRSRIDVLPLLEAARRPECGAIDLFLGTTRDHHEGKRVVRLEYEAYERMAVASLDALERAARERFQLG
jgi:molybdopterin synthase catalytic subunit